jgi:hypothetical protein
VLNLPIAHQTTGVSRLAESLKIRGRNPIEPGSFKALSPGDHCTLTRSASEEKRLPTLPKTRICKGTSIVVRPLLARRANVNNPGWRELGSAQTKTQALSKSRVTGGDDRRE